MTKKRLDYLDIAKGIGIILIVMGHTGLVAPDFVQWLSNTFHMALFFIISGMLIALKKEEERPFTDTCIKKCKQLLTPYFIFCALNIILIIKERIEGLAINECYDMVFVRLIQTFTLSGISVLWFLPALLAAELIFVAILQRTKKSSKIVKFLIWSAIIAVIITIFSCMNPSRGEFDVNGEWGLYFFENIIEACLHTIFAFFFLIIGYSIQGLLENIKNRAVFSRYGFLWIIALLCMSKLLKLYTSRFNTIEDLNNLNIENPVFFVVNSIIGTVFILCLSAIIAYIPIIKNLFVYCGKNSLIIMITHLDCYVLLIALKLEKVLSQYLPSNLVDASYFVVMVIALVLEVVIITITNRFFPFVLGKKLNARKS